MAAAAMPSMPFQGQRLSRVQGTVLVVDDEDSIRNLFLELFKSERINVRVAGSGQEAVAMVKQMAPTLVIVDVSLPDGDGIAVLEEVQKLDNRIIGAVMTGAATIELAVKAMKAGAVEFLLKPFQTEVVIATVRRLLALHQARGENSVVKHAAVRSGAIRLQNAPFHTFDQSGTFREADGPGEYERGLAEGRRLVEDERRQTLAVLTNAARQFDIARGTVRQTMEADVIELAFQVASKILHESAESCREQIIVQAKAGINALRDAESVVIQAHPLDAGVLEAAKDELAGQRDISFAIKVEAVPSLPRGSCLLQTSTRLVDASLETQLARLSHAAQDGVPHES
ncbi:MAG TPA: response regulator [Nitrospira sp.]|nr:response regulator [Nitrospira sp.]